MSKIFVCQFQEDVWWWSCNNGPIDGGFQSYLFPGLGKKMAELKQLDKKECIGMVDGSTYQTME